MFGIPSFNENEEKLVQLCSERDLVVKNRYFIKRDVHKFTPVSEVRLID